MDGQEHLTLIPHRKKQNNLSFPSRRRQEQIYLKNGPEEVYHWDKLLCLMFSLSRHVVALESVCRDLESKTLQSYLELRTQDFLVGSETCSTMLAQIQIQWDNLDTNCLNEPFRRVKYPYYNTSGSRPPGRPRIPCQDVKTSRIRERNRLNKQNSVKCREKKIAHIAQQLKERRENFLLTRKKVEMQLIKCLQYSEIMKSRHTVNMIFGPVSDKLGEYICIIQEILLKVDEHIDTFEYYEDDAEQSDIGNTVTLKKQEPSASAANLEGISTTSVPATQTFPTEKTHLERNNLNPLSFNDSSEVATTSNEYPCAFPFETGCADLQNKSAEELQNVAVETSQMCETADSSEDSWEVPSSSQAVDPAPAFELALADLETKSAAELFDLMNDVEKEKCKLKTELEKHNREKTHVLERLEKLKETVKKACLTKIEKF